MATNTDTNTLTQSDLVLLASASGRSALAEQVAGMSAEEFAAFLAEQGDDDADDEPDSFADSEAGHHPPHPGLVYNPSDHHYHKQGGVDSSGSTSTDADEWHEGERPIAETADHDDYLTDFEQVGDPSTAADRFATDFRAALADKDEYAAGAGGEDRDAFVSAGAAYGESLKRAASVWRKVEEFKGQLDVLRHAELEVEDYGEPPGKPRSPTSERQQRYEQERAEYLAKRQAAINGAKEKRRAEVDEVRAQMAEPMARYRGALKAARVAHRAMRAADAKWMQSVAQHKRSPKTTQASSGEEFADPPGTHPPHPGLVYDEQSHRYHRPDSGSTGGSDQDHDDHAGVADHPDVKGRPGVLGRVKGLAKAAQDRVNAFILQHEGAFNAVASVLGAAITTPDDIAKAPWLAGKFGANTAGDAGAGDAFGTATGVPGSVAAKVVASVLTKGLRKLGITFAEATGDVAQAAELLAGLANAALDRTGITVDAGEVQAWLADRLAPPG